MSIFHRNKEKSVSAPTLTEQKRKGDFSKKIVNAAVVAVVAFTLSEIFLLYMAQDGYPDAFVKCWFAFWSVELAALAGIKIVKTKTGDSSSSSSYTEPDDSETESVDDVVEESDDEEDEENEVG